MEALESDLNHVVRGALYGLLLVALLVLGWLTSLLEPTGWYPSSLDAQSVQGHLAPQSVLDSHNTLSNTFT